MSLLAIAVWHLMQHRLTERYREQAHSYSDCETLIAMYIRDFRWQHWHTARRPKNGISRCSRSPCVMPCC
ncbi:hypothetical protein EMIT0P395_10139 [Pseudomonas sp. IT-P395]